MGPGSTPGPIAYARGLALGALSVDAPADKPYGERGSGVRDRFGNTFWVSTYLGGKG